LQPDKVGSAPAFRVHHLRAPAEAHMPDDLESLCDLVELRAAKHHMPLVRLWKRVFAAIRDEKLDFGFPDEFKFEYGGRNPPPDYVEHIRKNRCVNALRAIENGDAVDPWKEPWVRRMLVSVAAFDKTLFPADQKRRTGPKSKVDAVVGFLKRKFRDRVPPGFTHKQIAILAKDHVGGVVSPKTVSRAIKKLQSDRTN
jgi:hypothetical protein